MKPIMKDYIVIFDEENGNTIYEFVNGDWVSTTINAREIPKNHVYAIFLGKPDKDELEDVIDEIKGKYHKPKIMYFKFNPSKEEVIDLSKLDKSPEENYKEVVKKSDDFRYWAMNELQNPRLPPWEREIIEDMLNEDGN